MPQVSYAKHALDCSQSGAWCFFLHGHRQKVVTVVPGHVPAQILLQFPSELGFLTALNHCVALLGAMKPFVSFLSGKSQGLLAWDFCNDI